MGGKEAAIYIKGGKTGRPPDKLVLRRLDAGAGEAGENPHRSIG
jgi:hypothetical protein